MIEQKDDELKKWVKRVVKDVEPSFAPPTDPDDGVLAISLYLLEIVDDPRRQHSGRPQLQPSLRYLVTTRAGDPHSAHKILGVLFFAALECPDFEVELDPVATELWSAFGIAPRPAFILRLPLPHEWQRQDLPLVAQLASPDITPLATLYGQVMGPGDIPLAGARVELPNLNRSATTGPRGRFTLTGVQSAPAVKTLLITARGREKLTTTIKTGSEEAPVIFPFDIFVTLYGRVMGKDNSPLAGAQVGISALQRSTTTDEQGRFILQAVPAAPANKQLTIHSGGREQLVSAKETGLAAAPIVFIFNPDSVNQKEA